MFIPVTVTVTVTVATTLWPKQATLRLCLHLWVTLPWSLQVKMKWI